jgi:deazaflavin-dependent oxidoreductase (nitroreductase family)
MADSASALLPRVLRAVNAVVVPAVKTGIGSPPPVGVGLVVVETTGRRSGLPREVPLVALRWGDRIRVGTARTNSQWTRNAEAEPSVSVWVCGQKRSATAELMGPDAVSAERIRLTM